MQHCAGVMQLPNSTSNSSNDTPSLACISQSFAHRPPIQRLTTAHCTSAPRKHSEGRSQTMATKYAFTRSLKEVRFLFCQTSEQSAATR